MGVKLFVGSHSSSMSSERLREVFASVGSVESASVVTVRGTSQSRGFGFVEMATSEQANEAVTRLNGTELDGRQIRVEVARPMGTGSGADRGNGRPGGRRVGRGGPRGRRG